MCDTMEICRQRVIDGEATLYLEDNVKIAWLLSHGYCNTFEVVGTARESHATIWIFPLDESYEDLSQTLSSAILLARDDRSFKQITENAIDRAGCKPEDLRRVSIRNVVGFLIPMAIMFVLAWLVQLFNWLRPLIPGFANMDIPV